MGWDYNQKMTLWRDRLLMDPAGDGTCICMGGIAGTCICTGICTGMPMGEGYAAIGTGTIQYPAGGVAGPAAGATGYIIGIATDIGRLLCMDAPLPLDCRACRDGRE
jgi:hypothetical protein